MKQKQTDLHREVAPPSLTLEQALQLRSGDILYQLDACNSDGSYCRWKVNGKVRTWKKDKSRVEIPVKHGMYTYGLILASFINRFSLSDGGGVTK